MSIWRAVSAKAIGTSHAKTGLPCQDSLQFATLPNGFLIAVIGDGAGSAEFAERGSALVTETFVRTAISAVSTGQSDLAAVLVDAAVASRESVLAEASLNATAPGEFASTLLAVIANDLHAAALQIGDGVIVLAEEGQPWNWVFWPQRGEYVNTTTFITDTDALSMLQVRVLPNPIVDLALMSDGLEPLAIHYASRSVHQPFFDGLFRPLLHARVDGDTRNVSDALQAFLASAPVLSRTDDDISLILATRRLRTS